MSLAGVASNHLVLEGLLRQRIGDRVTGLAEVGGVAHLERVLATGTPIPGAYVIYGGDEIVEASAGLGKPTALRQIWQVALVLAPDVSDEGVSLNTAGALMSAILGALVGWRPGDEVQPLNRINDGESVYYASGLMAVVMSLRAGCVAGLAP